MPHVTLWNYPSKEKWLTLQMPGMERNFLREIKGVIAEIGELHIGPEHVTINYADEQRDEEDRCLIVHMDKLFDKPERTPEVLIRLAATVGKVIGDNINASFPREKWKVEVFVETFGSGKTAYWER